jgi:ATP-binding cassette subfamily B protein
MGRLTFPLLASLRHFLPLKEYFVQNRWILAGGLLCLLVVDFLQLLIPLVIKEAVDVLTTGTAATHTMLRLGATVVGIALMMGLFRYIWRRLLLGHSRVIEEGLRNRIYRHLQKLSLSFYQRTQTGDLMARAINDINGVRMATGMGLVALTDGTVLGIAAIGFMLSINVKLTLISLIPMPFIVALSRMMTRKMSVGFENVQTTFSDLTERVREAFAGSRIIQAYSREDWAYRRVSQEGRNYIHQNMKLAKTLGVFFPMTAILTNLGLAVVIGLGGRLTILDTITTGDFVAFISYLNLLTWPTMAMGWVTNLIQRGAASMRRINSVLQEPPDIQDASAVATPHPLGGRIHMSGIGFRYPGQRLHSLQDIHLHVASGETIALVGRVGSGKTTLLSLIPRLREATEGVLRVDGIDIGNIPLKTLRQSIGFVTQEPFLFSDSIRNNLAFGLRGATREELETALHAADMLDDIRSLDRGMDTRLGERGISLSGGQRQRLTIARALLSRPPILILDDAFSMVDTQTENRILDRLRSHLPETTTWIVSHRVATIRRAERIIVLEQGRIVQQGYHQDLLAMDGPYASIYERQLLAQELEGRLR